MGIDWLREFCLSLPHTTEQIQWEDDLVFKVGGKMYAVAAFEPGPHWMSFKCNDEDFAELIERPGIVRAPYLARAHWIAIESETTLARAEIEKLLSRAHALILSRLPKKTQAALGKSKRQIARNPTRKRKAHS
jgi:predicted DNA-binding protein (MmcQ/YjbR family)